MTPKGHDMSCLIVGCGYLGRRVGEILANRHEQVYGTTRKAEKSRELESCGIIPVIADVLDPTTLVNLPEVDRVFYCVGFDRTAGIPFRTVYVDGLRQVLAAISDRTKKIVYASSTGVYGRDDGDWVDEDSPPNPSNDSGRVCLEAEGLLSSHCVRSGLDFNVVRFSGLYGPGRIIRRAALERGEPISGNPSKFLNLIHIQDAALASIAVLDLGASGRTYLASDDNPVERQTYYRAAAKMLEAPEPIFVPQMTDALNSGRDESNKRVSNRRIKEELGFRLSYPHFLAGLLASR